jgi:hypothetical protein
VEHGREQADRFGLVRQHLSQHAPEEDRLAREVAALRVRTAEMVPAGAKGGEVGL